jgi:hypothetical protein
VVSVGVIAIGHAGVQQQALGRTCSMTLRDARGRLGGRLWSAANKCCCYCISMQARLR